MTTGITLGVEERRVLAAVGCGLRDDEIAMALAVSEEDVAERVGRLLGKLGLRDRGAAIVHAFDSGLVVPGLGPRGVRTRARVSPLPSASPSVSVSVLGPLRVWRDGRVVPVGHARQQAVLAALALAAGRVVGRQELLDGVWGVETPAANVVPVYVYRLRKALRGGARPEEHPVIVHERGGYRLSPGAVDVDVVRLEGLVAEVGAAERAGDLTEAVRGCARALALFRGEPLAGLPGPLAELERLRLTERRIALVRRKAEYRLRLGQCAEAVGELFGVLAAHPLDEPVAALLMRALARSGRRADAVTVYDRTRRRLAEDLGVPPSRMLRRTHQWVLRGD